MFRIFAVDKEKQKKSMIQNKGKFFFFLNYIYQPDGGKVAEHFFNVTTELKEKKMNTKTHPLSGSI